MPGDILNPRQEEYLKRERQLLTELQACFDTFEVTRPYSNELRKIRSDLAELFLLVVVGEFNAGKSAFINALLGRPPGSPVLQEANIRNTEKVIEMRYGEMEREDKVTETHIVKFYPSDFLSNMCIVDTPGINSIEEHKLITTEFIERSDFVLYVMSVSHVSSQNDREMLAYIHSKGIGVIIIINRIDKVNRPEDLRQAEKLVKDDCEKYLGFEPKIFPLSALKEQEVVCQELCKISASGCLVDGAGIISLLKCKLRMTA